MAKELEDLYGEIDALEFFLGVMIEKPRPPLMFGQTLTEVGSPYSLKGAGCYGRFALFQIIYVLKCKKIIRRVLKWLL